MEPTRAAYRWRGVSHSSSLRSSDARLTDLLENSSRATDRSCRSKSFPASEPKRNRTGSERRVAPPLPTASVRICPVPLRAPTSLCRSERRSSRLPDGGKRLVCAVCAGAVDRRRTLGPESRQIGDTWISDRGEAERSIIENIDDLRELLEIALTERLRGRTVKLANILLDSLEKQLEVSAGSTKRGPPTLEDPWFLSKIGSREQSEIEEITSRPSSALEQRRYWSGSMGVS